MKTKDTIDVLFLKIDTQEEQFLVEAGPLYRLFDDGNKSFEVFVGGRVFILKSEIDIYPISIEDEHDWVEPFFGGRFRKRLSDKWTFGTRMHLGGFGVGSELTAGAQAVFAYDVTPRTTVGLGYRYQYLDYDGDEFGMESHMHGPLVGVIYRF